MTAGLLPDVRARRRAELRAELAAIDALEQTAATLRTLAEPGLLPPAPQARPVDMLPAMQRWRLRARPPLTRPGGWVPTRPADVPAPDRVALYMAQPDLESERNVVPLLRRLRARASAVAAVVSRALGMPSREALRRRRLLAPLALPGRDVRLVRS